MNQIELEQFYGRKETLEILKRRVLDLKEGYRQNIAFLGDRYTGKTMIVRKFLSDLDDPQIVPLYVDFEITDISYFFYKIAGSLLHHYGHSKGLAVNDDLPQLAALAEPFLPETVKAVKKIQNLLAHNREQDAYVEILSLPQIFTVEANAYCIVLLDEFQLLENLGLNQEFQELGKQIMTQRRCLYVVTSSVPWAAHKILSEKLSLLFGNFEVIDVQPFDQKTSQEFVKFHLPDLQMGKQLTAFLIDFTGGHPLYLTLICQELRALCALYKQKEIFLPLLTRAVEETLNQRWGVLNRHFDLIMDRITAGKGNLLASHILFSLTQGRKKISELTTQVQARPTHLSQQITRLMEQGLMLKNGNYYYLPDKLFKYWLRFVLHKRRRSLRDNSEQEQKKFQEEFARAYENSRSNAERDLASQVIDLLNCFENESLSINGRRYKLPAFHEVVPTRVKLGEEYVDLIQASSDEGPWLIILKAGSLSETEIAKLLAETKKFAHKPQRSVLIALESMDENARVRALQERMWIWNERELNTLTTIFDKSLIGQRLFQRESV